MLHKTIPVWCLTLVCMVACSAAATTSVGQSHPTAGFLKQHCYDCHGPDQQEAGVRLDTLSVSPTAGKTAADKTALWARVLDALEAGEMPPVEQPRPNPAAVKTATAAIVQTLTTSRAPRPLALRRMNRREYENTVHDLLGIEVPLADLLPEDGSVQGFDNVADGLSISSVLMEQYLTAANVAFDAVIRRIEPLPAKTRRVQLMEVKDNIASVKGNKGGVIEVANSFVKFTPGWPPARFDDVRPIEDGVYRCRVAVWPHDPGGRTLSVEIFTGALFGTDLRKFIGVYDVTGSPDKPTIVEFTTFMKEGDAIHVLPRVWPEHVTWRDKHEKRPGVGIVWAETHGPLDQSFPSESQKTLFGDVASITMKPDQSIYMRHRRGVKLHIVESSQPREDAARIIREFMPRAFRRPVTADEMQPFVDLTLGRLDAGRTFEQAVRTGFTAVLCSPQFLLLNRTEAGDSVAGSDADTIVDDYTLASRLSYFLWSTLPDDELLQLAAAGKLRDADVRKAQVERMIHDPRISRFVENFTGQWLDQRDIEFTTPAGKLYPEFDPLLQHAMLSETREFFTHILQEDLSVTNFVDADFTFLNERLARHYGIDGVTGHEHFRKVQLPKDSVRGGVLSQASVLKVTANGTTTSPVIRGVWVMDNILGRPLPPPPPGVPAVEPDIRGAVSIRDQLQKHREDAACARCHKRIDPAGFALEEFDAIGGSREWYRTLGGGKKIPGNKSFRQGPDVEPADQLAGGRTFADFKQFRARLLEDPEQIARALATKLLIYGCGRPVTATDRAEIDAVVKATAKTNYGLKSMIHAVVENELFLTP